MIGILISDSLPKVHFIDLHSYGHHSHSYQTKLVLSKREFGHSFSQSKYMHVRNFFKPNLISSNYVEQQKNLSLILKNSKCILQVNLNNCLACLRQLKNEPGIHEIQLKEVLSLDTSPKLFKEHVITGCQEKDVISAKNQFLDKLVENITAR